MIGQLVLGLQLTVPAWLLGELLGHGIVVRRKRHLASVAHIEAEIAEIKAGKPRRAGEGYPSGPRPVRGTPSIPPAFLTHSAGPAFKRVSDWPIKCYPKTVYDTITRRLINESEEQYSFINAIITEANEGNRDLREEEVHVITKARSRIDSLKSQLDELEDTALVAKEVKTRIRIVDDQISRLKVGP